jgi:hypothetical protein
VRRAGYTEPLATDSGDREGSDSRR